MEQLSLDLKVLLCSRQKWPLVPLCPTFFSPPSCSSGPCHAEVMIQMTLPQESLLTHQKMIDIQRMSEEKSPNIHKIIHKIIQKNWPSMLSMPSWHCQVLSPGSFSFLSSARLGRPPPKPPTLMVLSTILLDDFLVFFHVGSISWQWMWHFKIWSWVFGDKENYPKYFIASSTAKAQL